MAKVQIAYEEAHECAEGCACESSSAYLDQVQQSLAELGSDDPAGDVARNAKYVRGAQRAKLEPKQAAAMILAMSQRDPADYQPRYRYEDVAEAGEVRRWYVLTDKVGQTLIDRNFRSPDEARAYALANPGPMSTQDVFIDEVIEDTRTKAISVRSVGAVTECGHGVSGYCHVCDRGSVGAVRPGRMARKSRSSYRPGDLFVIEWFVENGSKKGANESSRTRRVRMTSTQRSCVKVSTRQT